MNISRVSVGIHPSGSVVKLPILISFEEVGLAVSFPDKDRVYVGNISFERPISVVVDLPGSQKFSFVVIFPEPKDKTEKDKIRVHQGLVYMYTDIFLKTKIGVHSQRVPVINKEASTVLCSVVKKRR